MAITAQIAKHLREVYFGGNWTSSNFKQQLADVTWEQATTKIYDLNTILTLVYHSNYYVHEVLKVLNGAPLLAKDKYSFEHPNITNQAEWEALMQSGFDDVEEFAQALEQIPDAQLDAAFSDEKYGNYYRNMTGIVEHCHYHLGQIVIIKKILNQKII